MISFRISKGNINALDKQPTGLFLHSFVQYDPHLQIVLPYRLTINYFHLELFTAINLDYYSLEVRMNFLITFAFGSGFYDLWISSERTLTYHYYSALAEEFNCLITLGVLTPSVMNFKIFNFFHR